MSKVEKRRYSLFSDGMGNGGDEYWVAGTDLCSQGGGDGAPVKQQCPQECDSQTESSPLPTIPRRTFRQRGSNRQGKKNPQTTQFSAISRQIELSSTGYPVVPLSESHIPDALPWQLTPSRECFVFLRLCFQRNVSLAIASFKNAIIFKLAPIHGEESSFCDRLSGGRNIYAGGK
ncbi:hypothetical protein NPIL_115501 [Nephila pilipes]|uniref:Uncharacterized protein n=1 Tax=Nephila pilipes TaxID=299642 RepID=A0A8X6QQN1_NEPPI|nr:hypothetical protein NPIL_115501 [Nephila pilipes]